MTDELTCLDGLKPKANYPKQLKTISEIEDYWNKIGDVLGAYRYVLIWMLNFKQDSSGKGVPFDLPYLDFYNRFFQGKKLIEQFFANASDDCRSKYYVDGFKTVVDRTTNMGDGERQFKRTIDHIQYARKWFNRLRGVLFLEAQKDDVDASLAPLSKKYCLTEEEAKQLPKRLNAFIQYLGDEIKTLKNPDRRALINGFKKQVTKYHRNLRVPSLGITINAKVIRIVLPRTNNCIESFFRLVKSLLRRNTGRSKLPREFGSVGGLLPYYLSMRGHGIFKEIFSNDQRLTEEFAGLFSNTQEFSKSDSA